MIYKIIELFPPLIYLEYYERLFISLNIEVSSSKYLTAVVFVSLLIILLSLIWEYFILLGAALMFVGLLYPVIIYRQTIHDIRSELPKFILDVGSGMLLGLSLIESIRLALNDNPSIKRYFHPYMRRLEEGKESINEVLISFANRFKDREIQLVVFQLINSISSGSPKELKQLGMQLLKEQMFRMREFGNRLQIISQFYIVLLLLFPIYTFLILIMSMASEQPIPDTNPILLLFLPIILALFVYLISFIFPSNYLIQQSSDISPLLLNWIAMIVALYLNIDLLWLTLIYILISLLYLYHNLNKIQNVYLQNRLEAGLLDVALILSSLPRFDMNGFMKRVIDARLERWDQIARKTLRLLDSGVSMREVFDYLYRLPSRYVKVFVKNLEYIYYSGISSHERVNEWLDIFINMLNLRKEMESQLSTFKYTIFISFIIIPFIYALLYDLSKNLLNIEMNLLLYLPMLVVGSGISILSTIYRSPYWPILLSVFTVMSLAIVSL